MSTFYVTFGQKSPFRDGWVEIEADDIETARKEAFYALGQCWSHIYDKQPDPIMFGSGRIGRKLRLPPGYVHS